MGALPFTPTTASNQVCTWLSPHLPGTTPPRSSGPQPGPSSPDLPPMGPESHLPPPQFQGPPVLRAQSHPTQGAEEPSGSTKRRQLCRVRFGDAERWTTVSIIPTQDPRLPPKPTLPRTLPTIEHAAMPGRRRLRQILHFLGGKGGSDRCQTGVSRSAAGRGGLGSCPLHHSLLQLLCLPWARGSTQAAGDRVAEPPATEQPDLPPRKPSRSRPGSKAQSVAAGGRVRAGPALT